MNNNPIAAVIRNAYIKNVLSKPIDKDNADATKNTIANILRNKRISLFENAINSFLTKSGQAPVSGSSQFADEKNLLTFSLQLSGYIRDAQKALSNLSNSQACDPDLIDLYRAAAKYSVSCNGKIKDSKYIFTEHCDYKFWKIINRNTLADAEFIADGFTINPRRRNLFISMPFHITPSQPELQKWSSKYLNQVLDRHDIFGSKVDVYLSHFPIEQPRGEKLALSLETVRSPQDYFETADMEFVKNNWTNFLGKDIKLDADNQIISGKPHSPETFKNNCGNITILGYCAGVAHAHRWINAFEHLAEQIYDKKTVSDALKNIFVVSYAFLPAQKENKYSGAHFMSNFAEDSSRKEPFIKMFNPELYEQSKYIPNNQQQARITIMPDKRNYVIALNLPENFAVWDNGEKHVLPDLENGHHMGIITQKNANSVFNYPLQQFSTVLENASLGSRGKAIFNKRNTLSPIILSEKVMFAAYPVTIHKIALAR